MKLWHGRFEKANDKAMDEFNSSVSFDCRLWRNDITGSIAHARMLGKQGIIPVEESERIINGLMGIASDLESGALNVDMGAEDIHMFVESELTARIGDAGKRLHTGRSRNDQVALDIRLYLRDVIDTLNGEMLPELIKLLCSVAADHCDTVLSGYTHLQKAQPVTLGHYLVAYASMFRRDMDRLNDCRRRMNVMPLGSGALAGTTYPLDRESVAAELGFDSVTLNSIDGVSDRDFAIEFASACSIMMMHLSRFCEELILWATNEFSYVTLDDAFSTGSSIMPQKKNPDACELIRGKTARVFGDLNTLLTLMKGLPLAYNKDMQEDKPALFDAVDTVFACLTVFTKMFATLKFNVDVMERAAENGFTNATDAADYLVKKGVPFRDAHEILGKLVLYCISVSKPLSKLTLEEYRALSPVFDEDIYEAVSLRTCIAERRVIGGPAPECVRASIDAILKSL